MTTPSEQPVIHIETVDLHSRGVTLPSDRVGMVIAQPYVSLTATEPYRCADEARPQQMAALTDTLDVALAARHGASITHFTVFPEYSIPGMEGIALVEETLRAAEWPSGTVVIGGTDGFSKEDFSQLTSAKDSHLDTTHNALARIANHEWVNCGIVWVKAADGAVERWLQPKLFPAWPEQNTTCQDMFRGKSVFTFTGPFNNGTQYRFSVLVCFDWIATVYGKKAWQWVLEDLERQAALRQGELSVSWLFVVQRNPKPSHYTFLAEVGRFFERTVYPNVNRDSACLVFANNAGSRHPGYADSYGHTSLVFSGQTKFADPECRPTFYNGGLRFRGSTLLSAHHDVLFRERGACVHSFLLTNPRSINSSADARSLAVQKAFIFPLNGANDPRVPSGPVPACVKWLNDKLDVVKSLKDRYPDNALAAEVDAVHQQSVAGLRTIPPQSAINTLVLATARKFKRKCKATTPNNSTAQKPKGKAKSPDDWGRREIRGLKHVVHTLDIIGLGFSELTIGAESAHATVIIDAQAVDLVAISGETHECCIQHAKRFLQQTRRPVLLISRDRDNNIWRQEFGSFLQTNRPHLGTDRDITDPSSGLLHLGYRKLLDVFLDSTTPAQVQGAIHDELVRQSNPGRP